jgi:hypothetical protein
MSKKSKNLGALGAMTIEEFCDAYRLGRTHVYEEIYLGRLKARKSGARTLLLHRDIKAWEDQLETLAS